MIIGISNKPVYQKMASDYLTNAAATKLLIDEYEEKRKNTKSEAMRKHYVHKLMALYSMYNECLYRAKTMKAMAAKQ